MLIAAADDTCTESFVPSNGIMAITPTTIFFFSNAYWEGTCGKPTMHVLASHGQRFGGIFSGLWLAWGEKFDRGGSNE